MNKSNHLLLLTTAILCIYMHGVPLHARKYKNRKAKTSSTQTVATSNSTLAQNFNQNENSTNTSKVKNQKNGVQTIDQSNSDLANQIKEHTSKPNKTSPTEDTKHNIEEIVIEHLPGEESEREVAFRRKKPPISLGSQCAHFTDIACMPDASIQPKTATDDPDDTVEINFEDANLQNILDWMSKVFSISFITEDALRVTDQSTGRSIADKRITFKTHKPLTKEQLWDLFLVFLDLWHLSILRTSLDPEIYQIVSTKPTDDPTINKSPLPAYIDVDWSNLPNNDERIRYVYFVKNSTSAAMLNIANSMKSPQASIQQFQELNALIMTDKSYNIRMLMQVIKELDKTVSPESMSVIKLKNTDAQDVADLYANLTKTQDRPFTARFLAGRPAPTKLYFPESTRVIAEPRTNSLIILGTRDGIKKVEDFIISNVDTELQIPYSPLYVYELQYAQAEDIVNILNSIKKFGEGTQAKKYGSVRDGDKYFQDMRFVPEPQGNRILIRAEKEDYLKIKEIIRQLDVRQPQVAVEVLIVAVRDLDNKQLGVQMRNKNNHTVSKNVDFQNSGLPIGTSKSPVQTVPDGLTNPASTEPPGSIVADLITLAQGQDVGSTLISVGSAATQGIWGLIKILDTHVHTNILSNPFLVTTNKYTARVSLGETRRIAASEIVSGGTKSNSFTDLSALLTVQVTPQINSDGIINLDIKFQQTEFSDPENPDNATRISQTINTNANVANNEVLAFGGLIRTKTDNSLCKVPVLGDVPLLGWFFKNKRKEVGKSNILVFISPHIIEPQKEGGINEYTEGKTNLAKCDLYDVHSPAERRDPIHRWFFRDSCDENMIMLDDYLNRVDHEPCASIETPQYSYPESCVENNQNCNVAENNADKSIKKNNTPITLASTYKQKNASKITSFMPEKKDRV